jgi:hypothetical protein
MLWNWYTVDSCKSSRISLPTLRPTYFNFSLHKPTNTTKASSPAPGASDPTAPSPAPASASSSSSSFLNPSAAPAKNTTATSSTNTARHFHPAFHRPLAAPRVSTIPTIKIRLPSPHHKSLHQGFVRAYYSRPSGRCCICCNSRWRTLSCYWQCTTMGILLFVSLSERTSGTSSSGTRVLRLARAGTTAWKKMLRYAVASMLQLLLSFVGIRGK